MRTALITHICIFLTLSLFASSCKNATEPTNNSDGIIVYENSFESSSDTVGWRGYGARELRNDPAPGGGSISLFVSGGCIVPHAVYDLPVAETNGCYKITCWGRNLAIGGGVGLKIAGDRGRGVGVAVMDTVWTSYTSMDSLFCPAGKQLRIEMDCGGIVYSAMLVDMIAIVCVD
jgi:hypothetical protein